MHALVRRAVSWLHSQRLAGENLVVAVSGGPDSVALLRALREGAAENRLVVAHLNHQLRGAESERDERFVRELADTLAAPGPLLRFRFERLDVGALANGSNLEQVARQVRYAWLGRVAIETGCRFVATGHTADDQAETVLHRLLRGTGLRGLRGIAPRRPLVPGVELLRPLLTATRAEVLDYLATLGQKACQDSTNENTDLTRNRIRHQLLPLLAREFNPAIARVLSRLASEADAVFRLEERLAADLLAKAERPRADRLLVFLRDCLATADRHCVRAMFRLVWEREGWPVDAMNFDAWDRLAAVAAGEQTAVDLPGDLRARATGPVVQLGPRP